MGLDDVSCLFFLMHGKINKGLSLFIVSIKGNLCFLTITLKYSIKLTFWLVDLALYNPDQLAHCVVWYKVWLYIFYTTCSHKMSFLPIQSHSGSCLFIIVFISRTAPCLSVIGFTSRCTLNHGHQVL